MALLTDPSGLKGRPFKILVKRHKIVCFFLYVSSIVLFFCLASDQINSATYLSENALLPGLVVVGSDLSREAKALLRELNDFVLDKPEIPVDWIRDKFSKASVESFIHNFTLYGDSVEYKGRNVYGIIRGGGSRNEAAVLSVPWRSSHSPENPTAPGLALLLAIAKYFRKQKYWAKDLIMLVTEHEQVGMQSWLEAYHGVTCGTGVLNSGDLDERSGAIQAAINLELHSEKIKYIDVKVSGLNGQLPNLDLVNLVLRMCSKERVRHSFANKEKIHNLPSYEQWERSLGTMISMLLSQASGVPDGNHGLFHRFGIEAVTMEGIAQKDNGHQVTLHHVGRVIEGLFRSINNLLERFHQSYFFYLLADTDRFVSIGLYMPCNGMLVAALFIRAFSLHVEMRLENEGYREEPIDANMSGTCGMLLVSLLVGSLADYVPTLSTAFSDYWMLKDRITIGYIAISVLSVVTPFVVLSRYKQDRPGCVLHILSLVLVGTLLLAVGMYNFSIAFLSGLIVTPIVLLLAPSHNRVLRFFLWLLIHPLVLLLSVITFIKYYRGYETVTVYEALGNSLLLASLDHQIYGSWTLRIVCLAYLSVWVALVPASTRSKPHKKTE